MHDGAVHESGLGQLGDAEVQQLGLAGFGDEDVGRFQVAVDHQKPVRVLHRGGGLQKELHPAADAELPLHGELHEGYALNILHDEEGHPLGGLAAVQQARDIGMFEGGQDLALVAEAFEHERVFSGVPGHFDRDPLVELSVGPLAR